MPRARHVGHVKGQRVTRVPIEVRFSSLPRGSTQLREHVWKGSVLARSVNEAADWARDHTLDVLREREVIEPFSVVAWGPRGGEVHRRAGWETVVGHAMFGRAAAAFAPFQDVLPLSKGG